MIPSGLVCEVHDVQLQVCIFVPCLNFIPSALVVLCFVSLCFPCCMSHGHCEHDKEMGKKNLFVGTELATDICDGTLVLLFSEGGFKAILICSCSWAV